MGKGVGRSNGFLPNSIRIISSCLKTVSTNAGTAVRSAGASVAASMATAEEDRRDQVSFDSCLFDWFWYLGFSSISKISFLFWSLVMMGAFLFLDLGLI